MNLAARLQEFRRKNHLTQAAAATLLGVPLRTWQNWEISRNTPRGFALHALEQKLLSPLPSPPPRRRPTAAPRPPESRPHPAPNSPPVAPETLATHLL
jgi:transcriptional regulator with XRE-family HTH domain